MRSIVLTDTSKWDALEWQRRLETFSTGLSAKSPSKSLFSNAASLLTGSSADQGDNVALATSVGGEINGICQLGELTDKGRETTLALGQRLRKLYIDQLKFMPEELSSSEGLYLRATPIPRALESVQQTFSGMYPSETRPGVPLPTIIMRANRDETLYPNENACARFAQLSKAFAKRAAERWNGSEDMEFVTGEIGKWMDDGVVGVDSRPRLSGVMDTVNSTLAHGQETRLPGEFYGEKVREVLDKVAVEEWFAGYQENREYRTLGSGGLVGDIVERMVEKAEGEGVKLGLSGCHDTTLAGLLAGFGAFKGEKWPPYTSHVALEMFKDTKEREVKIGWLGMVGLGRDQKIGRRAVKELSEAERKKLDGYYVRVRFNDRVMRVPGCKKVGNHLEGDESFCTLEAFKRVADGFTPKNWRSECAKLDRPIAGLVAGTEEVSGEIERGY